jgi:hypothetical protein
LIGVAGGEGDLGEGFSGVPEAADVLEAGKAAELGVAPTAARNCRSSALRLMAAWRAMARMEARPWERRIIAAAASIWGEIA